MSFVLLMLTAHVGEESREDENGDVLHIDLVKKV
jgi:hypothetical protein